MQSSIWIRLVTFLIWLLAAGTAVLWGLKWVRGPAVPPAAAAQSQNTAAPSDARSLAKALGGGQDATVNVANNSINTAANGQNSGLLASRFILSGVVSGSRGVALIAVDGKPPRAYRVGATLAQDAVLHSLVPGKAMLSSSNSTAPILTLELPKQASAMVGTAEPARPAQPVIQSVAAAITPPPGMPGGSPLMAPLGALTTAMEAAAAANNPKAGRAAANRSREGLATPAGETAQPPAAPAQ